MGPWARQTCECVGCMMDTAQDAILAELSEMWQGKHALSTSEVQVRIYELERQLWALSPAGRQAAARYPGTLRCDQVLGDIAERPEPEIREDARDAHRD